LKFALAEVECVAPTDSTVLILGETGTGKELVARAIHNLSSRCGRPFVKLNWAAIPFDLLESELLGHQKGAFAGAIALKIGRFEMADKCTLFLDEVGDIPPPLQTKLLLPVSRCFAVSSCSSRLPAGTHMDERGPEVCHGRP